MKLRKRLCTAREEAGQALVLMVLAMVVLIGITGFAVDVGHAYLVQRQLQAGVDAAALAGAQELPDPAAVTSVAQTYSATPSDKNALTSNDNATTNVTLRCLANVPGCSSTFGTYNAVRVDGTSSVQTFFARVLGINSLTVHATATACSPCAAKPLDIMIVLDRTGSMCDATNSNGACRDETNAVNGIKTFLGFMDPSLDEVGLAVFPPALNKNAACATPTSGGQNYGYNAYWPSWIPSTTIPPQTPSLYAISSPTFDYLTQTASGWELNPASNLIQMLGCVKPAGTTSYVDAIDEAQHELDVHGRGGVQDVVIILTDGAANVSPRYVPSYIPVPHYTKPCTMGIDAANHLKAQGTLVYTIGYDVDDDTNGGQCGAEGFKASWALQQMASVDPSDGTPDYYNQPVPAQLNTIFTQIAADISRPASRLIDNNTH